MDGRQDKAGQAFFGVLFSPKVSFVYINLMVWSEGHHTSQRYRPSTVILFVPVFRGVESVVMGG